MRNYNNFERAKYPSKGKGIIIIINKVMEVSGKAVVVTH